MILITSPMLFNGYTTLSIPGIEMNGLTSQIAGELRDLISGEIRFDKLSRTLYSTDASNYCIEPVGVVIPKTVDEVIHIINIARSHHASILPRGGGTSLAGQAVGPSIVIDFSKYLNRIIGIDTEHKTVTVEPGINLEVLNRKLATHSLMFGPDPSSAKMATVGGAVANNATGAHSILYGMAGDNVLRSKVVLSDGSVCDLGQVSREELENSPPGRISQKLHTIIETHEKNIQEKFPKHWRRASGYSLNYLIEKPLNTAKLLASSEGTLAVATELTLNLVPIPALRGLVILQFGDIRSAMDAVPVILEKEPSAIELIDKMLIDLTRGTPYSRLLRFIEGNPDAVLVVEFYGETDKQIRNKADELRKHLEGNVRCNVSYALSVHEQEQVWELRRAGLGLLMSTRGDQKPIPCIEDVSVPVENLGEYVSDVQELITSVGTRAGYYGHASAGCLHIRPLVNLKSDKGIGVMKELTDGACELALKYAGVLSGEHGDGLQRTSLNKTLFGPEIYDAMQQLKEAFDPDGILNPGKVVGSEPIDENLRYSRKNITGGLNTYLDWNRDRSITEAVDMCNGQGVCRKLGSTIMCPSFMATRDEQDTTRARANILRSILSGQLPLTDLRSDTTKSVFDLCISCKSCKTECPSGVDAAKMKTEVLAHHNTAHGISLRDHVIGHTHKLSQIASKFPVAANLISGSVIFRQLAKYTGIHPKRTLPTLADKSFIAEFESRTKNTTNQDTKQVVYFHDTWTSFYKPSVGLSAVKLLETLGYQVIVVRERACCGRTFISKGMVDQARANADKNASILARYTGEGIPIVGTEPSCISMFRDEYLDLLPQSNELTSVAENTFLLDEFIHNSIVNEGLKIAWKSSGPDVLFHAHCHQRSAMGTDASTELLSMAGCSVKESGAGCCGMAGSFGYEKEHYDVSKAIANDRFLEAIESSGHETEIVVSGFSCEHQIEHFGNRRPAHLAEILASQLAE